jgi:imidazolonepropionase-like amidohydrolase
MRNMIKKLVVLLILNTILICAQSRPVAFINATAHIGNGKVLPSAIVVMRGQKIEMVEDSRGMKLDYRSFDTVIDLAGKHIYPGLINTNNVLGLHDAEAVRATVDFVEVGALNSHVRSLIAYNTDNIIIPTVRTNGVLYTQVTPRGNLISGSSSVMALDGWNWEDAVLLADDGIHVNFPRHPSSRYEEERRNKEIQKQYDEEVLRLSRFFTDAAAYLKQKNVAEKNIRFEAMRAMLTGKSNLYLHADRVADIQAALNFAEEKQIEKVVLVGGRDAWQLTALLKKRNVPVMLNRVFDLPERQDEDIDLLYRVPYLLQKDSVLFCLQLEGDMEAMQSRNLPFNAGATVAYGLDKEQALAAISLNAAKILGLADRIGSLEAGKMASFVISSGDLLDMRSSLVEAVYMAGKKIDLNNHQSDLYNKYKLKYGSK